MLLSLLAPPRSDLPRIFGLAPVDGMYIVFTNELPEVCIVVITEGAVVGSVGVAQCSSRHSVIMAKPAPI